MGIFKAYDIRGIYENDLSEKEAFFIGFYFINYTKLKKIKLAKDYRISGENLTKYFILGVLKAGAKIEYQGEISTVNFYHSLFEGTSSGVIITASHNDKQYNGFKFIVKKTSFDLRNGLDKVEKLFNDNPQNLKFDKIYLDYKNVSLKELIKKEKIIYTKKSLDNYIKFLDIFFKSQISKKDLLVLKKLNFSIDYSSGMSGLALVTLFNNLGLSKDVIHFNFVPDGNFPNHQPDPSKAKEFLEKQKNLGSFVGVFDGDGDRISFYDSKANQISQDKIIKFFIEKFSSSHKEFVVDLRISRNIFDFGEKQNLKIEKLRVGRAYYQDYMKENNCFFGAELSGHFFFKDFKFFDNPDIALIYMLKFIVEEIKKIGLENFNFENLFEHSSNYFKLSEINLKVNDADFSLEKLEKKFSKFIISKIDGLSFDLENVWFNIRKSNTEPILRINLEGKTQKDVLSFRENLENILN